MYVCIYINIGFVAPRPTASAPNFSTGLGLWGRLPATLLSLQGTVDGFRNPKANHLGCIKISINNGIDYRHITWLAGFLSTNSINGILLLNKTLFRGEVTPYYLPTEFGCHELRPKKKLTMISPKLLLPHPTVATFGKTNV